MQVDKQQAIDVDEQTLIDYLHLHPDFFVDHPELLSELKLPHDSGKAVSLIEHQVATLRERNTTMRKRMNELIHAARENDELFGKTRSLNLALLEVATWHELNEVLATHVLVDFEADYVCCHVVGATINIIVDHIRNHNEAIPFGGLLNGKSPMCTTLRQEEIEEIFPMSDHAANGSAVLLPLNLYSGEGVLCIGSRDPERFVKEMDTLFVQYIADILSKVMNRLSI